MGACLLVGAFAIGGRGEDKPDAKSAAQDARDAGSLEYWMKAAKAAETQPATQPQVGVNPFEEKGRFHRPDALPGVVQLSDGQVLPGWMYTTVELSWMVYVEGERRWRLVPFITVLSITAVVEEEKIEQKWRWKEMGVPERVYTGEEYPTRRLKWQFHLIDDSTITGTVKGQPLWVEYEGQKSGPFVLHERSKGEMGQKLEDLVYMKQIIVSRRTMEEALREGQQTQPKAAAEQAK